MNDTTNKEDQWLWKTFLSGDDKSLETLYRRYFNRLYDYGNKWFDNATLVEDSIQDLFIKLIKNHSNLSGDISVKHYLFKAFRSVIFDKLRSKKIMQDLDEHTDHHFALSISPEAKFIQDEEELEIKQKLEDALKNLTPRQREAIFLRYEQDIAYNEIADMMSLTTKATYKLMARAIDALKVVMQLIIFAIF